MSHAALPHPGAQPAAAPAQVATLARPGPARPAPPPAAERYRGRLLQFVSRLTAGDRHHAEDIVQETMLRAWLAADEFAEEASGGRSNDDHLAAWLHTVARNLAVDAHRRDRCVPMGLMPSPLLNRTAGGGDVAETVVNRVSLLRAMARLRPAHRDILVHVHVRDQSREDTARLLGIPKGTVKSRVHYALVALRSEWPAA
jgi:RNA polymerase sigma-70 factor (ECF subfamily)